MSTLRIFDASQYIHAGVLASQIMSTPLKKVDGIYTRDTMPSAGIANILNAIVRYNRKGTDLVFCIDSAPTYKRELHTKVFPTLGGYKGNRGRKEPHIQVQRMMIADILESIGVRYFKVDGYEADDLIASLVEEYASSYDEVIIHSKDSDMYYLVRDNVKVEPVMRQGKVVTRSNWERTVKKDYIVPYNTLTIEKMACGESGDNIPYVYKKFMDQIIKDIPTTTYPNCGDNRKLRQLIADIVDNDVRTMAIFDLIAPLIVPTKDIIMYEPVFNTKRFLQFASRVGCDFAGSVDGYGDEVVNGIIEKYINEYKSLQE